MNGVGLMHATMGLVMFATQMGLLRKVKGQHDPQAEVIHLGVKQTPYILRVSDTTVKIMKELIQITGRAVLFWPESAMDTKPFGDSCLTWLKAMRSVRVDGVGPRGGSDNDHQYAAKHGCRLMLSTATGNIPDVFRGMTVSDVLEYSPDERSRLASVTMMQADEARSLFGVPALWLPCLACLLNAAGQDVATWAMSADDEVLRQPVLEWERDLAKSTMHDDFFAPCIKLILEEAYHEHSTTAVARVMKRPAAKH